jgi:hypothetical protein
MRRPSNLLIVLLTASTLPLAAVACANSSNTPNAPDRTASGPACPTIARTATTTVPNVVGESFTHAFARLLSKHLLVSVPRFIPFHDAMAEQGWGRLANYQVVAETPRPGTTGPAGTVVTLRLTDPIFRGQLGSMAEPLHHPRYAHIPNLIGEEYPQAMAAANSKNGILVRVDTTAPLRPNVSSCGLRAFVVSAQTPKPSTRVLWGGITATGVDPSRATVTITLTDRISPLQVSRPSNSAHPLS